ncbi:MULTISPECIES: VOC family protein [unclassified Amycolatopsis]|uniref:VOC family protein n=1 Tax=unclassified Amycolatopsis TaxID=2618356 RepID=UPI002875598A|nr:MULTISPECIES: VOC family protein [unclassified Amycolatopsis]MDS0132271.1 VOC family protein [Amycolatopsis sp. 505]MDS0142905.1 VOC family protein [Amycolatopsis sp. CM201R]
MVNPVPEGYTTVTPWIIGRDTAGLLDFLKAAFDAEELGRVVGEDGKIGHAEVRIGDAVVMAFDSPDGWDPTPAFLRLYVPDSEETQRRAIAAGATEITRQTVLFFGDRVGRVRDPFGHLWWIQTRLEDLDEAELARRAQLPEYVEAMNYVQGAKP